MYYFLAKLWCVVSMVLIVVEANGGGLVVAELKDPVLGGTKPVGAIGSCVSFGVALVEAGVPLL